MQKNVTKQIDAIVQAHKAMIAEFQAKGIDTVIAAAGAITDTLRHDGTVYLCGNGGSAADAQHIAAELVGRFEKQRTGLRAVALTTDSSITTSLANDYGYDTIFARQVDALVRANDLLWALSTSGSSPNIVAAARLAKNKNAFVLAFTGKTNSTLQQIADICFCAESQSTARSQEIHQLAYHIICMLVEQNFCEHPDHR